DVFFEHASQIENAGNLLLLKQWRCADVSAEAGCRHSRFDWHETALQRPRPANRDREPCTQSPADPRRAPPRAYTRKSPASPFCNEIIMGRRAATKGSANFKRDNGTILGRPLETRCVGKLFQRQDLFSALSIDCRCGIVEDAGLFAFV